LYKRKNLKELDNQDDLEIDFRFSPGFIGGGTESILPLAIHSDRFRSSKSTDDSCFLSMDVESLIRIGNHYAHNEKTDTMDQSVIERSLVYAISGDCDYPGIYELPANTKVRELVEIAGGKNARAVQLGGITGKFISKDAFDHVITDGDIQESTNVIIYGPQADLKETALKILTYCSSESCGQCAPCREGSNRLFKLYQDHQKGNRLNVLDMESIIECMQQASRCEFGRNAARGFQSMLKQFPELV
jgi:NADH:ubiquinone oxidoreductase subunit F (NADH-binding)